MTTNEIEGAVRRLAIEYREDVLVRRRLGDKHAEYHAQNPKVDAFKLLLDAGRTPSETVREFERVLATLGPEVLR